MATELQKRKRSEIILSDASANMVGSFDYDKILANITDEQRDYCRALTKDVDLENPSSIQQYAYDSNNIVSRYAEEILKRQKSSKNSESLDELNKFVADIHDYDVRGEQQKPVSGIKKFLKALPIVGSFVKDIERTAIKNNSIDSNVDEIQTKFQSIKVLAMKDNNSLEEMRQNAYEYVIDVRDKIIALMLLRDQLKAEVDELEAAAVCDLDVLQSKRNTLASMNIRITDMTTYEYMIRQSGVQILTMMSNNNNVIQLADQTISQAIPMLKYQLAIDLMAEDTKKAADTSRMFKEMANKIATSNAEKLNMTTVDITKQSSEPFFDVEMLRNTTASIIDTINQIREIRNNSEAKQQEILAEIKQCGIDLSEALKGEK